MALANPIQIQVSGPQKNLIVADRLAEIVSDEGATPVLRSTSDYGAMRALALRAGLEDGNFEGYDASFGCFVDDTLIGCAALKVKEGLFTVECLAVSEEYRGRGMGRSLIAKVEAEAVTRGASQIWALARAPGFFMKNGYRQMDLDSPGAPSMKGCATCPQYNNTCKPAIVLKML